jgi:ShK domain-like
MKHQRLVLSLYFLLLSGQKSGSAASSTGTAKGECIPVSTELSTFHCYSGTAIDCTDADVENCPRWASQNECTKNAKYMQANCRKSCNTCVDGHVGVTQIAPDAATRGAVASRLAATAKYLLTVTAGNVKLLKTCQNRDPQCTYWAVRGQCSDNAAWMQEHCGAACRTCHEITYV